jgi:DNA-binding CsgD family transcriptional regulator
MRIVLVNGRAPRTPAHCAAVAEPASDDLASPTRGIRQVSPDLKLVTWGPRAEAPGSNHREARPVVGFPLSGWESSYADGRSGQPGSSVSDTLTAREREVLAMISQGFTNKRIARILQISPETVKSHVKHIFLKLAVSTRAEAVSRAGSLGPL